MSLALGVSIFAQLPSSSLWALGIVVGVEILSRGIATMAGALTVRGVLRQRSHVRGPGPLRRGRGAHAALRSPHAR